MGEGLADGATDFDASGREWRPPPLWGIGLVETVNGHTMFLHDGPGSKPHGSDSLARRGGSRVQGIIPGLNQRGTGILGQVPGVAVRPRQVGFRPLDTWPGGGLLTLAACGGNGSADPGETKSVSREDVLTSLTTLVIVPRYRQAADAMGRLADSVETLCSEPNAAALERARSDWRGARNAWVTTEAFRFGPAMDRRSQSLVDWWPVSVERIDHALSGGDLVTEETVRQFMPATQRGIGAMERLLFAEDSDSLSTQGAAARCGYLKALTSVAHEEIEVILHDWEGDEESPGYAGFFDGSANSSLHPRVAEAEVVRSLVSWSVQLPTCGWGPHWEWTPNPT